MPNVHSWSACNKLHVEWSDVSKSKAWMLFQFVFLWNLQICQNFSMIFRWYEMLSDNQFKWKSFILSINCCGLVGWAPASIWSYCNWDAFSLTMKSNVLYSTNSPAWKSCIPFWNWTISLILSKTLSASLLRKLHWRRNHTFLSTGPTKSCRPNHAVI